MTPRVLKRVNERVAEHWGERLVHLIEPFCTQARRGPKLPPWFVAVWLMRKQFGINMDGRDSELAVVWFGCAIGEIPLYDAIFRQIRSSPWDELAVPIGELDPEIIGVSGDLKTDGRVEVTFRPEERLTSSARPPDDNPRAPRGELHQRVALQALQNLPRPGLRPAKRLANRALAAGENASVGLYEPEQTSFC